MRYHFIQQQIQQQQIQRQSQQQKMQQQKQIQQQITQQQMQQFRPGAREPMPSRSMPSLSTWCRVLQVCRSGYHAYLRRTSSQRSRDSVQLLEQIRQVHLSSRATYGSPRVHAELRCRGVRCSLNRVARLMRQHHISARVKKRHVVTTDSSHSLPVAENLLAQEFTAAQKDQRWVCDITYIWTEEGWLYLAAVLDLFSRRVVGFSVQKTLERELVIQALRAALLCRRPSAGLLCHSDRGSQYASQDYQHQLTQAGLICSMSRKGNCYDNAVMESFFASFKQELIHRCSFHTTEEARLAIFEWIEVFYNRQRRHSSLGYLSPAAFEQLVSDQSMSTSRIAA